jgi:hypothetical protein
MTCCGGIKPSSMTGTGEPGGFPPPGTAEDQFIQFNGTLWVPSAWILPDTVSAGDLGEVLTVAAAGVAEFQPLFQRTINLQWGARVIGNGLPYLYPWVFDGTTTAAEFVNFYAPMSGRIKNMRVVHAVPIVSADDITYTFALDTIDTALAVTLNTNTAAGSNLVDVIDVNAIQAMSVKATGQTANRTLRTTISFDFEF